MKKTSILSFLLVAFILSPMIVLSQRGTGPDNFEKHKEKIEAQKVAYITDKLDLSPEEAEKFWPVYNAHHDSAKAQQQKFRKKYDFSPDEINNLSDTEAKELIEAQLQHEQMMFDNRKKFHYDLLNVISAQKVLRLFDAEKKFRVELMHRVAGREQRMRRGR